MAPDTESFVEKERSKETSSRFFQQRQKERESRAPAEKKEKRSNRPKDGTCAKKKSTKEKGRAKSHPGVFRFHRTWHKNPENTVVPA